MLQTLKNMFPEKKKLVWHFLGSIFFRLGLESIFKTRNRCCGWCRGNCQSWWFAQTNIGQFSNAWYHNIMNTPCISEKYNTKNSRGSIVNIKKQRGFSKTKPHLPHLTVPRAAALLRLLPPPSALPHCHHRPSSLSHRRRWLPSPPPRRRRVPVSSHHRVSPSLPTNPAT